MLLIYCRPPLSLSDVQMACFEFASLVGSILTFNILPHVGLIQSIILLLSEDEEGLPVYRNAIYDSTIGLFLTAMYPSCSDVAVELTAESLVLVFPYALQRTKSEELKLYLDLFLPLHMFHSNDFLYHFFNYLLTATVSTTLWGITCSIFLFTWKEFTMCCSCLIWIHSMNIEVKGMIWLPYNAC